MQPSLRVFPSDVDFVPPAKPSSRRTHVDASEPKFEPRLGELSLTIRGLRKSFGTNDVLCGMKPAYPGAGQFRSSISGRSGCGKSTLLRLIAGLETATTGSISFGENTRAEDVRVMFQEPRLLPWATVAANVEIGLGRERAAHDTRRARRAGVSGGRTARQARAMAEHPVGRTEAACRACPRAGQPSARAGVRRTARCTRCFDQNLHAAVAGAGIGRPGVLLQFSSPTMSPKRWRWPIGCW